MAKSLVAKCGATKGSDGQPFKSVQGVKGHERLCPKCQSIKGQSEQPKGKKSGGCDHKFRVITEREAYSINPMTGERLGDIYDLICERCGELK